MLELLTNTLGTHDLVNDEGRAVTIVNDYAKTHKAYHEFVDRF